MAASAFLWYKMDLLQRLQQCWFSNVKIKISCIITGGHSDNSFDGFRELCSSIFRFPSLLLVQHSSDLRLVLVGHKANDRLQQVEDHG